MAGWIDYCPVVVGSGDIAEIDVRFLYEDEVSIVWVDLIEKI